MTAIVGASHADATMRLLAERGVEGWPIGEVVSGSGTVKLV
jgi:phosphoribosylaminoimidazole (AIR) synthetase